MKRQSRPSRPRRQGRPEGAARGLEPPPGAALNGPGQSRGHRRGPERFAIGHRKENRGRGLVETRVAARVTWTETPSGAVPVAGRASDPSHMPAHPPVTTGPGGGTGRRARAVHGGTGRTVSQGPYRAGRALARGGGRQGPRANTWRRLIQRRRPTSPPDSRAGLRARATLKSK